MMKNLLLILTFSLFSLITLASTKFHFAIIGDRTGTANQPIFESVVSKVETLHPDIVLNVGDLPEDGLEDDWQVVLKTLDILTSPFYFVPGNNDILDEASRIRYIEHTNRPTYYSFDYENSHFIIMDNSMWESFYELKSSQIVWLINDLERNKHFENIFVFMHKPFWYASVRGEVDPLHNIFKHYNVKAVFTGHLHQNAYQKIDGIEYFIVGSSGGHFSGSNDEVHFGFFYQFMWCTVIDGKLHTTLIKEDGMIPSNIMSAQDQIMFNEIQNGLILTKGQIREGNDNVNLTISIQNKTNKTIKQNLIIETGDNWSSLVSSLPIEILPGETYNDTIKLTKLTSIYPLPRIKFIYPFGNNLEYQYNEPIILERVLISSKIPPINTPTIDGIITPSEWDRSIKTTDFGEMDGTLSPVEKTELSFMHDDQFLYIAINCYDSRMNELRSNAVDRDGNVHLDDAVGMIITPNPKETYQFYTNSIGTIWDQKFNKTDSTYHPEWNGSFLIANSKDDYSWRTEIRISLKELNYDPSSGQIKINFRRKQPRIRASALLSPLWNYEADLHPVLLLE
ncbi:MAG: hypothetical protein A2381_00765 [Bdellovibrionales bacterium RIFOXYB1_FULL_37_110]|nr:MAG: hypothetical protein A2417_01620 [Bdellovibrionales bacterium RIFOXYC1_FULL_37_79]OFZ58751.1 MAG: hypothetical protein A2381_00765 [Bdellovibrionales bacterium RIFOXYB1_FULL_37_110]OFZ64750.1 MAG: hypothetical protein A2577_06765 [Bdellovibrionales bacterium RIFOXYD1_FULL_36_51]